MTRQLTRKTSVLRVTALLMAVPTVLIALAALAQTRATSQPFGKSHVAPMRSGVALSGAAPMDLGPLLFLPAIAYGSGGYEASTVVVADINRDGKPDLVVANECAGSNCTGFGSVSVLLGHGDGTFQPAVTYDSGGSGTMSVAVTDVNGDGKLDVVVVNQCDPGCANGSVGVLLGNGDGSLRSVVTYESGDQFATAVAIQDVNNDGKPDLVVTNACSDSNCDGTVGVLLGNGDGTFHTAVTYGSGGRGAQSVKVADVNHDGRPDLLVANDCAGSCQTIKGGVSVLLSNGNGTFQLAVSYDSGGIHANSVVVADVNGDGRPDLLVSNLVPNTVGVLLGNGDGTFQPPVPYDSGGGNCSVADSVAVADVNGDGKPDILVTNDSIGCNGNNEGAVGVLFGTGDGTFQTAVNYRSGGYQARSVAVSDVNGDGRPDLLIANFCSTNNDCGGTNEAAGSVGVLLNNNGAPPTTTSVVSSVNPAAINWEVTYTATVTPQSGGTVQGTVTFYDGFAAIATVALAANQASYSTSYPTKGTHSISATYSGDLNKDAGSTSDALTEVIEKPSRSKTVVATSGSPSFVGQPVTFTATVTSTHGSIPDGEIVTFYDGTTVLGSVMLSGGTAALTTSSLLPATHIIKAIYAGDAGFKSSIGTVKQVVSKYPTTTALTSSPNPSQFGQAVTFTAKVTSTGPSTPTGRVKFLDGTTTLGSATLSGSTAKLARSSLAVGTHAITAQYLGDSVSDKSTSLVVNQVVQ